LVLQSPFQFLVDIDNEIYGINLTDDCDYLDFQKQVEQLKQNLSVKPRPRGKSFFVFTDFHF